MLRRLYNAKGVLLASLPSTANRMQVDLELRNLLESLDNGDWVYLSISDGIEVEIIKVVWIDAQGVYIERAKDFTEALEFDVGATVKYALSREEILDLQYQELQLFYTDAITVEGQTVTYPEVLFEIFGAGVLIGDDGNYVIGRKENAYGCCNGNNLPYPIAPSPVYIVSKPYPLEAIESVWSDARLTKGHMQGVESMASFIPNVTLVSGSLPVVTAYLQIWYTTTTTPDGTEIVRYEGISSQASLVSGSLPVVVGYVEVDTPIESIAVNALLLSGSLPVVTAYIEIDAPTESMTANALLVSGILE